MTTRNDKPMLFIEELWRNGPVPQEAQTDDSIGWREAMDKDRANFKYEIWMKPPNDHPISLGTHELFWRLNSRWYSSVKSLVSCADRHSS